MAWDASQDAEQYRASHHLQRCLGARWLVMWGPGSRTYWAYYCGPAAIRPVCAPTPQHLLEHVHTVEGHLAAGIEPDKRTPPPGTGRYPRHGY